MKFYSTTIEGKILTLERTMLGRAEDCARRSVSTFIPSAGGLGVLLGIEYIGRGTPEGQWPVYLASVLGLAAVLAFAFGLARLVRKDIWALDLKEDVLAFETSNPLSGLNATAIDLSEVRAIRFHTHRRSRLIAEIGEHHEVIAESWSANEVRSVATAVDRFLTKHRARLRVEGLE